MNRILIIGCSGAGKTTLARKLGAQLGLPGIHLDAYFWDTGWEPMPRLAWQEQVDLLTAESKWVMDGNYSGTMERRIAASDAIVFLDLPRWRCLLNVIKRRIHFAGRNRPEMAHGNRERVQLSFLWFIWTYRHRNQSRILRWLKEASATRAVFILQSHAEVASFLAGERERFRVGIEGLASS